MLTLYKFVLASNISPHQGTVHKIQYQNHRKRKKQYP